MKQIYVGKLNLGLASIIAAAMIVLIGGLTYAYFSSNMGSEWGSIISGLIAGLTVALIQFLLGWHEFKRGEKLDQLQIREVLLDRDNRSYYQVLIASASNSIDVMGVTGSRFMDDFANSDAGAQPDARILFTVLDRGVKVRFIMPKLSFLSDREQLEAKRTYLKYSDVMNRYPESFAIRFCEHVATHSIFKVDEQCILGPVFPKLPSKHTPALHMLSNSPVAKKYIVYFNDEWDKWQENRSLE